MMLKMHGNEDRRSKLNQWKSNHKQGKDFEMAEAFWPR